MFRGERRRQFERGFAVSPGVGAERVTGWDPTENRQWQATSWRAKRRLHGLGRAIASSRGHPSQQLTGTLQASQRRTAGRRPVDSDRWQDQRTRRQNHATHFVCWKVLVENKMKPVALQYCVFECEKSRCGFAETSAAFRPQESIKCRLAYLCQYEREISAWNFALKYKVVPEKIAINFRGCFILPHPV